MSKEVEEWRDIPGFEGLYQVSDWGRVKSLGREVDTKNQYGVVSRRRIRDRIIKPALQKNGYLRVSLYDVSHKPKSYSVHRLVAEAFIDNTENKPVVGHTKTLDNGLEDKTANEAWNLAWMTYEENNKYGTLSERNTARQLNREDQSTPINVYYYPSMDFICTFPSQREAERKLNLHNLSKVLKGIYKQEKGYTFRYV